MTQGIAVSVVVPTHGRPALLEKCLAALVGQDFDPARYEVIVADDGDSEETRVQVARWADRAAVRVAYVQNRRSRGPAAARNAGWRAARGEIIAFTDDDCLPVRSWLRAGLDAFVPGVVGAWGQLIMPLPPRPRDYHRDAVGLERAEFVTANCFYRREALAAVGGFDERFTQAWREDSDLFFSLLERDSPLVYAPGAIVIHPVREAPWGVSLRQQKKSMFNALLFRKHPRLYRERIQTAPPRLYYAIVLSLTAILAGAAAGTPVLWASAGATWMLLTGWFCGRRLRSTSLASAHVLEMIVTSALIPPLAVFWRMRGAVKFRVFFL